MIESDEKSIEPTREPIPRGPTAEEALERHRVKPNEAREAEFRRQIVESEPHN